MGQAFVSHASGAWNWVLSPGLSQWSAQMVEVCETMAESSVMHRSSASTKAGTGMEDSLSVPHAGRRRARRAGGLRWLGDIQRTIRAGHTIFTL